MNPMRSSQLLKKQLQSNSGVVSFVHMESALDPEEVKRELLQALQDEEDTTHPERINDTEEEHHPLDALGHPAAEEDDHGLPVE